jgi:hypothetical protein
VAAAATLCCLCHGMRFCLLMCGAPHPLSVRWGLTDQVWLLLYSMCGVPFCLAYASVSFIHHFESPVLVIIIITHWQWQVACHAISTTTPLTIHTPLLPPPSDSPFLLGQHVWLWWLSTCSHWCLVAIHKDLVTPPSAIMQGCWRRCSFCGDWPVRTWWELRPPSWLR